MVVMFFNLTLVFTMNKYVVFAVLCLVNFFIANSALASHIHVFPLWDNTGSSVNNQLVLNDGDLTLTVTAWTSSYGNADQQRKPWEQVAGRGLGVYRDDDGLGVLSNFGDGNDLDGGSHRDRNTDPDEGLLFVFSHYVELLDVFVGDLDRNDDVNFSVVNVNAFDNISLGNTLFDQESGTSSSAYPFEFESDFNGSAFMVWVDGKSDDVEVLGIAVVPEPAPILLFALGLLCMALRGRKS